RLPRAGLRCARLPQEPQEGPEAFARCGAAAALRCPARAPTSARRLPASHAALALLPEAAGVRAESGRPRAPGSARALSAMSRKTTDCGAALGPVQRIPPGLARQRDRATRPPDAMAAAKRGHPI